MAKHFADTTVRHLTLPTAPVTAAPLTIACWFYPLNTTQQHNIITLGDQSSDNDFFAVSANGDAAGDRVRAGIRAGGGFSFAESSVPFVVNEWNHITAVFESTSSRTIYLNGANNQTNGDTRVPSNISGLRFGNRFDPSTGRQLVGSLAEVVVWNVAINTAEMAQLVAGISPGFIRPQNLVSYSPLIRNDADIKNGALTSSGSPTVAIHPRIIYPNSGFIVPLSGASVPDNQVVNSPLSELGLTSQTPTITVSDHKTIDTPLTTTTLTTLTPTVTPSDNKSIAVPLLELALTPLAPTVATTDHKTISVPVVELTLSPLTPSLTVSDHKTIASPLAELTLTAYEPTITATNNISVSVPLAELLLAGSAPDVITAAHQIVSPDLAELLFTGLAPTVSTTNNVSVSVPLTELALTPYAPTIQYGENIQIDVPTIRLGQYPEKYIFVDENMVMQIFSNHYTKL